MAGAAGSVFFHLCHCITPVFAVSCKKGGVTITTAVHFKMAQMREPGGSRKLNLLYRMAPATVFSYRKGGLPVMAGTA